MTSDRLLILGESCYWSQDDADNPDITEVTVGHVIDGTWRHRFFTAVEGAVTGRLAAEANPAEFWQSVAFANYAQGAVESGGATRAMMKAGRETIDDVLNEVKPTRMLVVSRAVWADFSHLNTMGWKPGPEINAKNWRNESGYLVSNQTGLRIYCTGIPNPASRGFGEGRAWNQFVKQFLEHPVH